MSDPALPMTDTAGMLAVLRGEGPVIITTHTTPDADALGSQLGLLRFLRAQGREVRAINADAVPEALRFLDGGNDLERWDAAVHEHVVLDAALIVCVDLNERGRCGALASALERSGATIAVIDHHLDPKPFAHHYLSVIEASSTAEIVLDLITAAGMPLDFALAQPLYAGIVTDTGSFRFERTTPALHRKAALLLEAGVDPQDTHRRIYDDYPVGRTMLLGRVLADMRQVCDGRVTILRVTRQMFEDTGTSLEDVENIVNYGLGIRGVEATALLTEVEDTVKISFRSRGAIAVNTIAQQFNGGGHRLAAGGRVYGQPLESVTQRVVKALCKAVGA
ncbi:MAG: bifunctional oligoribonuclease/PAP phosphatase NrnA [Bacteroidia bacterium]|nr:bifunctional oligoribonuclease/PAP phosphatase NrnA [Bacteroidia bacterium]